MKYSHIHDLFLMDYGGQEAIEGFTCNSSSSTTSAEKFGITFSLICIKNLLLVQEVTALSVTGMAGLTYVVTHQAWPRWAWPCWTSNGANGDGKEIVGLDSILSCKQIKKNKIKISYISKIMNSAW